jgi:hypothetical protein
MIDGRARRPWLFKMTLSCSKHAYEKLVERQDMETFLRCHEHAFAAFGGVPEIVTLDNIKAAVLLASIFEPIINQTYLSFATHWGFAANPCMPRCPEHKGVVERDIGYTKHNALDGRRFNSLEEGNVSLRHWNKRWARTRIHGTTKCQVWKLFTELEQPRLQPLQQSPFEFFRVAIRKVDVNGLVEVEARYYAAPSRFVGDSVVVHFNKQWIKMYHDEQLIITHRRLEQRGRVSMPASCLPAWKHPNLESQERYYCRIARQIGPSTHTIVYRLLGTNDPLAIRRVRGILSLPRRFSDAVVENATTEALSRRMLNFHTVKSLCEHFSTNAAAPSVPALTQQHDLIRPLSDYETIINERTFS